MVLSETIPAKLTPVLLEERLVDFAVRMVKLGQALDKGDTGRSIGGQLIRAGTSPAANYAEARSAESRADFVHKLRIVIKELNETSVWLRIIAKAELLPSQALAALQDECAELQRIIGASLRTANKP